MVNSKSLDLALLHPDKHLEVDQKLYKRFCNDVGRGLLSTHSMSQLQ